MEIEGGWVDPKQGRWGVGVGGSWRCGTKKNIKNSKKDSEGSIHEAAAVVESNHKN